MVRLLGGGMVHSVRSMAWALDESRPTEGSHMTFLQFEGAAAASLVFSGYDFLIPMSGTAGSAKAARRRSRIGRAVPVPPSSGSRGRRRRRSRKPLAATEAPSRLLLVSSGRGTTRTVG